MKSILVALLVAVGLTACASSPPPPRLVSLEDGSNGSGIIESKINTPYVFPGIAFCLDRPGTVVIDSVEPYKATGGLVVQDFAFVPNPFNTGRRIQGWLEGSILQYSDPSSPDYIGADATSKTVSQACPPKSKPTKPGVVTSVLLYVQFIRTDDGAIDQGVVINYTSAGQHESLVVPWQTWICAKGVSLCPGAPGYVD